MDITTIFGLLAGAGLILSAIVSKGVNLSLFWDGPSLMLVLGGTLSATLVNYSLKNMLAIFGAIKNAFLYKGQEDYGRLIDDILMLAKVWRSEGLIVVKKRLESISNSVLRDFMNLALDEKNPDKLEERINLKVYSMQKHRNLSQDILYYMGTYAPAFGMIGTVVGLIIMMKKEEVAPETTDVLLSAGASTGFDQLMEGMGLALITTLYGVVLANLLFFPLSGKLRRITEEQTLSYEIIREGVLSIYANDLPREIREKCLTLIPHSKQTKILKETDGQPDERIEK